MSDQELWQEYDEFSFLAQAKSSYDYVNNANFMKYSNTEMSKDFYRQAVKALNNAYDVVTEAKFILPEKKVQSKGTLCQSVSRIYQLTV